MPFRGVSQPFERRGEELGDLHSRKDGWAEARVRQELIEQCFSSTNTAYHCTGKSPGEGGLLRPPEKARAPQSVSPSGRLSPQPVAVGEGKRRVHTGKQRSLGSLSARMARAQR